jgi:hypothetical protein
MTADDMTLVEALQHAEDEAYRLELLGIKDSAEHQRRLANWLTELLNRRKVEYELRNQNWGC